jgi:hypothetical protein
VDPHAEKYPNINPYVYVANNPINAIDPDGRDIVVLSYGAQRRGHKYGHNAILVGSDKKGWTYFSLDGDGPYEYGDGQINDGYTISKGGEYKTLKDFAQSEFNTFKEDYDDGEGFRNSERDSNGNLIQRYEKAFQITTTEEQDTKMFKTATEVTEKDYDLFNNRCTNNVNETLKSGDQKSGDAFWPSTNFRNIEENNKGKRVDSQLKINNPKKQ